MDFRQLAIISLALLIMVVSIASSLNFFFGLGGWIISGLGMLGGALAMAKFRRRKNGQQRQPAI